MLLYPSKSMPAWDMGFSSIQYVPQTNAPHARMNAVVNGPPDREAYIYMTFFSRDAYLLIVETSLSTAPLGRYLDRRPCSTADAQVQDLAFSTILPNL